MTRKAKSTRDEPVAGFIPHTETGYERCPDCEDRGDLRNDGGTRAGRLFSRFGVVKCETCGGEGRIRRLPRHDSYML